MFSFRVIGVALAIAMLCVALSTVTVLAVDPTPGASGLLIDPLDPRAGAGANRTGTPLVALLATIGIGAVTAVLTAMFIKVSRAR